MDYAVKFLQDKCYKCADYKNMQCSADNKDCIHLFYKEVIEEKDRLIMKKISK